MKLYKCIITGDEMFSDVYKIKETENGFFYEVEGKTVMRKEGEISDEVFGGNASADEPVEGFDTTTISGVDIVLNHHLQETAYNKKQYVAYIKDYMKQIVEKMTESNEERVAAFKKEAKEAVPKILNNLDNYQFFIGQSMNPSGMVALLNYREDGITPFLLFFKDGLEEEKL